MRFKGRYSDRYDELNRTSSRLALDASIPNVDIADAKIGKIRVNCWVSPKGRRWGKYTLEKNVHDAGVLRFQITLDQPPGHKLSHFELELMFSDSIAPQRVAPGRPSQAVTSAGVSLLQRPSPAYIEGLPMNNNITSEARFNPQAQVGGTGGSAIEVTRTSSRQVPRCWVFRSVPSKNLLLAGGESTMSAAKWVWEANPYNPQVETRGTLHGGVAVRHERKAFLVSCNVRGKAFSSGFRFWFGTKKNEPRLWQMEPRTCDEDITAQVDRLEAEMEALNRAVAARRSCRCRQSLEFLLTEIRRNITRSGSGEHSLKARCFDHFEQGR